MTIETPYPDSQIQNLFLDQLFEVVSHRTFITKTLEAFCLHNEDRSSH